MPDIEHRVSPLADKAGNLLTDAAVLVPPGFGLDTATSGGLYIGQNNATSIRVSGNLIYVPAGGGDDSVTINAAISGAPSGSIVVLVPGQTYNLVANPILMNVAGIGLDFRGATIKVSASNTIGTYHILGSNNYIPTIYVSTTDVKIWGGTIDNGLFVNPPLNTSVNGIICDGNASRVTITGVRVINTYLWPFWIPYGYNGVNSYATDVNYIDCRAASSGNTATVDGGGFKTEGSRVRYIACSVDTSNAFGWDLAPGNGPAPTDVELIGCRVTNAVAKEALFIEDFNQNDIRIIGGEYSSPLYAIHIYGGPGSRMSLQGVTAKSPTAGTGTCILVNQGTSTGGRVNIQGCTVYNGLNGIEVGCISGAGTGSVSDVVVSGNNVQGCTTGILLFNNASAPSTLANITVCNNDVSGNTTPLALTGTTANGGGAGISLYNNIGATPDITMATATSQIVPGTTSLALRNNANNANNLLLTDAGVGTMRNNLSVGGIVASNVANAAAVWDNGAATGGHQWKQNNSSQLMGLTATGQLEVLLQMYPGAEASGLQTSGGILHSTGIPSNTNGNNNDWCISDNGHIYFKSAGTWAQKI